MSDFKERAEAGILESVDKLNDLMDMMSKTMPEEPAKAVSDNSALEEQRCKHMYAMSFVGQTDMLANVLRANHMPQETINMCLAARCGLPMQKIDPKSPCFVWVEDEVGADIESGPVSVHDFVGGVMQQLSGTVPYGCSISFRLAMDGDGRVAHASAGHKIEFSALNNQRQASRQGQ